MFKYESRRYTWKFLRRGQFSVIQSRLFISKFGIALTHQGTLCWGEQEPQAKGIVYRRVATGRDEEWPGESKCCPVALVTQQPCRAPPLPPSREPLLAGRVLTLVCGRMYASENVCRHTLYNVLWIVASFSSILCLYVNGQFMSI